MTNAMTMFDGWELDVAAAETPRVRDIDIATRGGMKHPRKVRELIERNRVELEIYGSLEVRPTVRQTTGGRPGNEYWLTEEQAVALVGFMRTPMASAIRVVLVRLFMAYRRGQQVSASGPSISAPIQARIGDDDRARSYLSGMCRAAAKVSGRSVQSIHGSLRKPWGVASIYRIALSSYDHTAARVQEIIDSALNVRRLPAHRKQTTLPFPTN